MSTLNLLALFTNTPAHINVMIDRPILHENKLLFYLCIVATVSNHTFHNLVIIEVLQYFLLS